MDHPSNQEMEETNCNQKWLFAEDELLNTPSVRAGVTLDQELTFRQKQAMLIQTIGLKSGLTQLAVNTSVIFMHRFFMYRTVKTFPRIHLALGFAFAGGKVEESARKLEHIIRTAVEVIRHNRNKEFLDKSDPLTYEMDSQWRPKMQILFENNCNIESPAYLEMRKLVLECETEIYGVIGFQLQIVHPHNYVIRMCALLGAENIKDISQYAYNLATASSQLTMLCLKYKPETIATMCLNIASKAHSVRFEPMKDSNVKWYQVLVPNTDFAEIEAVSEEFLNLIKGCPLLPSWMTNLARMSRANNNRAMPGPSRGPGASSVSAPPGGRQNQTATSSTTAPTAPGNVPPSSSTAPLPQNHPTRPQTATSQSSSQGTDSRQLLVSSRIAASQLQNEAVISPGNKHISAETGASGLVASASDALVKDSVPSSHSRPHPSSGSAQMRPHHSSSALPAGAVPHQQHRAHPPGNGRPANQTVPSTGSSRPPTKPSVTLNPQGARPPQFAGQPGHHPASQQALPRPTHDQVRNQEAGLTRDQSRSYSDALKGQRDHTRSRDNSRPHESLRSHDTVRHGHPDHRPDLSGDAKHISHPDPSSNRSQSSRPEHTSQRPSTLSPNTPPSHSPPVKSSSPSEPITDISQFLSSSGDTQDTNINVTISSPENALKPLDKQQAAATHGPKLSLRMYRERASAAKSKTPIEQTTLGDNTNAVANVADDSYTLGVNPESATNSPADVSLRLGSGDLAHFHKPQDSPSNPRIKIRVKRDPSSGERHAVKYAETGLKIKIKPIRSETASGAEGGDAGPSGLVMASSASTPREEGEIVEDTPPSSGDSEQKSERLKIRLSVPKSDQSSSYTRRESDQGSNGHSGEHDQSHHGHHHSHHRSSHHGKSKRHSKHDRSRHEVRTSSKRSASAQDYYDERPSKTSRSDTHSTSTGHVSHHHTGYSDTLARSHQQNTGFSIHDAFSSTMPHNIFDDDDDPAHSHPPVTPTVETVPPHHERFHQLMAQHRARVESVRKPPLPKGPPPPKSSPPPPPPPPPTL